ncbi:MAG: hypothetical protein JWQ81_7207 [Amycolatopsis sp.]|uniref:DUF3515 domain-containing protein n=1 Tax=Amycolatopsis sp. TaxID=37632 RepID=UPI0026071664|nr:DUF3515 domain-containing protein [Amycolatopsis sp.]MCU1686468.1 hypothetical protein [Amycolatopsis sp.]
MAETDTETGAPPRLLIIVAAVLVVGLAVGVAIFGIKASSIGNTAPDGQLALVPVPAPHSGEAPCRTLIDAVPSSLTSNGAQLTVRDLATPAPPSTVAWGEGDPIVLRCGLDKPPELTPSAQLRLVNGVQWLQVTGEGAATWYIVDRDVYTALTVPDNAGTGPLQEISDVVAAKLPARPLHF